MVLLVGRFLVVALFLYGQVNCAENTTPTSKHDSTPAAADVTDPALDLRVDEDSRFVHTENGYIISLGIGLLCVITITSFVSKKYKIRILPDATLCLLYGIVIGIVIRYGRNSGTTLDHGFNLDNLSLTQPPKFLLNTFHKHNYIYKLQGATQKIPKESYMARNVLIFDPEIFFYLILPPIMFVAGLRMNKKHFVKNFTSVMVISIVGSFITAMLFSGTTYLYASLSRHYHNVTFLSGSECMLFGAIVAPTDPVSILNVFNELKVEPNLNSIVFGESALNDVVSLVLYEAVEDYAIMHQMSSDKDKYKQIFKSVGLFFGVLFGSIFIGIVVGAVGAMITKTTTINEYPVLETAFYIIISYSSYLIGEILHCTGVVSILFCGMFNSHYTNRNLSYDSRKLVEQLFDLIEFIATNFVFSYIGISLFAFPKHEWNVGFIFWSLICLLFARAAVVYGFCYLLNLRRRERLPLNSQHVLFFAGLKGAVSFALAIRNTITQSRQIMLSTTLTLVLVTVLVFGSMISRIIKILNVPVNVQEESSRISGMDELCETNQINNEYSSLGKFMKKWHEYDLRVFIPLFTKSGPPLWTHLKNMGSSLKHFCCCTRKPRYYPSSKYEYEIGAQEALIRGYSELPLTVNEGDDDDVEFNENISGASTSKIYGFSVNNKDPVE